MQATNYIHYINLYLAYEAGNYRFMRVRSFPIRDCCLQSRRNISLTKIKSF